MTDNQKLEKIIRDVVEDVIDLFEKGTDAFIKGKAKKMVLNELNRARGVERGGWFKRNESGQINATRFFRRGREKIEDFFLVKAISKVASGTITVAKAAATVMGATKITMVAVCAVALLLVYSGVSLGLQAGGITNEPLKFSLHALFSSKPAEIEVDSPGKDSDVVVPTPDTTATPAASASPTPTPTDTTPPDVTPPATDTSLRGNYPLLSMTPFPFGGEHLYFGDDGTCVFNGHDGTFTHNGDTVTLHMPDNTDLIGVIDGDIITVTITLFGEKVVMVYQKEK